MKLEMICSGPGYLRAAGAAFVLGACVAAGLAWAATDASVKIDNFTFGPEKLTVKAGTTVTWTNEDDIPHTVASSTKAFKSKALDTDDSFSFTFTTPAPCTRIWLGRSWSSPRTERISRVRKDPSYRRAAARVLTSRTASRPHSRIAPAASAPPGIKDEVMAATTTTPRIAAASQPSSMNRPISSRNAVVNRLMTRPPRFVAAPA